MLALTMFLVLVVGSLFGAASYEPHNPGQTEVYEICSLQLSDGTYIGTVHKPCVDVAGPEDGVVVIHPEGPEDQFLLNCVNERSSKSCFTYTPTESSIFYTVYRR